jgi:hypothetical protein
MERQRFRVSFFTVGGGREMMDVEIIISFFLNKDQVEVAPFKAVD